MTEGMQAASPEAGRAIVFDVTDIVQYVASGHTVTGIQRAALMMMHHVARRSAEGDAPPVRLGMRTGRGEQYSVSSSEGLARIESFDADRLGRVFGVRSSAAQEETVLPQSLRRYAKRPAAMRFHALRNDIAARRGDADHFARRGGSIAEWRAWRARRTMGAAGQTVALPKRWTPLSCRGRGPDGAPLRLCVLGAMWNDPRMSRMLADMAEAGAEVTLFVHDLIALREPEWFDPALPGLMLRWLVDSRRYATRYVANSEATLADLEAFFAAGGTAPASMMAVPLAQSTFLPAAQPVRGNGDASMGGDVVEDRIRMAAELREETRAATRMPYALCVGTMETRKNLWRLCQAWLELARADPDVPRLVLAGKRGWLNDDFFAAFDATGGFGGRVAMVQAPSDVELAHLYRNCAFTACVSLSEGWGLPIGEGLAHGRTGIVSRVGAMREVGGDLVEYCDPRSIASIREAAERLLTGDRREVLERRIAGTALRSWERVADDLMAALDAP